MTELKQTSEDLEDILGYIREKGFDLNWQLVVCDIGNGVEPFEGAVLTKDNKIVTKYSYIKYDPATEVPKDKQGETT